MFVYSRGFGGAKYVDAPKKQPTGAAVAAPAKTDAEKSAKMVEQPAEEKAHLIYTEYPPVTLYEGEMLEAVLVNHIIADTEPSPVVCHLARDLNDHSARYVVLPANSRVIGSSQVVNYKGAHRLFVNFSRIGQQPILGSKDLRHDPSRKGYPFADRPQCGHRLSG